MFGNPELLRQRLAVSGLVGNCEGLLKSDALNPSQRASLRLMLEDVLDAYGMPKKQREAA